MSGTSVLRTLRPSDLKTFGPSDREWFPMRLTRSQFMALAAGTAGAAALSGCTEITRRASRTRLPERLGAVEAGAKDPAWRVLNRTAFGPRPGDLERVREMGVDQYL